MTHRLLRGLLPPLYACVLALSCFGQGIITTVAGSTWIFSNHFTAGGSAVNAPLGIVTGVAVDSAGNVYASDSSNDVVVKISSTGSLTVVAGNGTVGFSGDGGPAVSASLNLPYGLAVDTAGNLYIADSGNNRVRKVDSTGTITTIAGNGQLGLSGDGGPATIAHLGIPLAVAIDAAANIYIADSGNNRVRKVNSAGFISTLAGSGSPAFSGDGGPAISASLYGPAGIAVDAAENVYIADTGNNRVRVVTPGGTISTVAGNGIPTFSGDNGPATDASLNFPQGLTVDTSDNIYIADTDNSVIRKVSSTGTITTIAGNDYPAFGGDGLRAIFSYVAYPQAVASDSLGNIYIADSDNERVRRINGSGLIATIGGDGGYGFSGDGGPAMKASLDLPFGVTVAGSNVYIADTYNNRIRKVDSTGTITTIAGNSILNYAGDGGPAVSASLAYPEAVASDTSGNLYIADFFNSVIRKINSAGIITTVAGNTMFAFTGDGGGATGASLNGPSGVAVDSAGNIYIADYYNNRIRKVTAAGVISTVVGSGKEGFSGDGGPAINAGLYFPSGVAVDMAGSIYIADYYNNRIRKVNSSGTISTVAGNGKTGFSGDGSPATSASLNGPTGVVVDAAGNIYIADYGNNRVRKVNTAGIINTVAGNGTPDFSGDGGPATNASLNFPNGVALDNAGDLYIADTGNNRVRMVTPSATTGPVPSVPSNGVINNAGFANSVGGGLTVSPGLIAAIYGSNLATVTTPETGFAAGGNSLLTTYQGTSVTFDGIPAPLYGVSPGQVNVQVPFEVSGKTSTQVVVSVNGVLSAPVAVPVLSATPGIVTVNSSGSGPGVIQNQDGTQNTAANPVAQGNLIQIYATGLGPLSPPGATGQAASFTPLSLCVNTPTVTIGGVPVVVSSADSPFDFCGLAASFVGLWQVNVRVPTGIATGADPLILTIGGVDSNTVTVFVK